jgi:small conductance mechanosensitive channel
MKESATWHKILDWVIEAVAKYSFQALGGIVIIAAGFIVAKMVAQFAEGLLKKHHVDVTVSKFIVQAVRLIVVALAVLVALGKFGFEIAPLVAGLSVVGFATSFALQGPLSNYAAGATLIFTKPFKVGDIIEVAGETGVVEDMTLPRTLLRTVDKTLVVIPNKHIIGEVIHNYSADKRVDIKVGIAYKANADKAIGLLREIVVKDARIIREQETKIGISDFGDSSVNLCARLWCKQHDYWDVLFDVNKAVLEAFRENGIDIPFPQRDVHIFREKP